VRTAAPLLSAGPFSLTLSHASAPPAFFALTSFSTALSFSAPPHFSVLSRLSASGGFSTRFPAIEIALLQSVLFEASFVLD
jgi:hypothetical protein